MHLSAPLTDVTTDNRAAVLAVLANLEESISGRRIHELAERGSLAGIQDALKDLTSAGLVLVEAKSHALLYRVNRDHLYWEPIRDILDSRYRLIWRIYEHLGLDRSSDPASGASVSLFGSTARGDATRLSDVDIAIIYRDEAEHAELAERVAELPDVVRRWTGNQAQVFDVTRAEFSEMVRKKDPLVDAWLTDSLIAGGPSIATLRQESRR